MRPSNVAGDRALAEVPDRRHKTTSSSGSWANALIRHRSFQAIDTDYPPPFDQPCRARERRKLWAAGDHSNLHRFRSPHLIVQERLTQWNATRQTWATCEFQFCCARNCAPLETRQAHTCRASPKSSGDCLPPCSILSSPRTDAFIDRREDHRSDRPTRPQRSSVACPTVHYNRSAAQWLHLQVPCQRTDMTSGTMMCVERHPHIGALAKKMESNH